MKTAAKSLLLIGCLAGLSGCNTVEGAAKDVRGVGEATADTLNQTGRTLTGKDDEVIEEPDQQEIE